MRLWHIDLIKNDLLPKSQLLAQWRELCSIYQKQDKHILINYIYKYDKAYLWNYSLEVIASLNRHNIKITNKSQEKFKSYFADLGNMIEDNRTELMFPEHNIDYLEICYWNLREKYIRGQKDFTKDLFDKLFDYYINIFLD